MVIQIFHPFQHVGPGLAHQIQISGLLIQRIRHKDHRAAPSARPAASVVKGRGMGHMSGLPVLGVQYITHPLGHKRRRVHIHQDGLGGYLTVPGIAQPLPMRAIQGHPAVLIGAQAHNRGPVEPIQNFIVAGERSGDRMIGGHKLSRQLRGKALGF